MCVSVTGLPWYAEGRHGGAEGKRSGDNGRRLSRWWVRVLNPAEVAGRDLGAASVGRTLSHWCAVERVPPAVAAAVGVSLGHAADPAGDRPDPAGVAEARTRWRSHLGPVLAAATEVCAGESVA